MKETRHTDTDGIPACLSVGSRFLHLITRLALATSHYTRLAPPSCTHAVHAELPAHNLRALWHNEMRPMTGLPDTECVPHLWAWKEQREIVMRESSSRSPQATPLLYLLQHVKPITELQRDAPAGSRDVTTTAEAERRALLMVGRSKGDSWQYGKTSC